MPETLPSTSALTTAPPARGVSIRELRDIGKIDLRGDAERVLRLGRIPQIAFQVGDGRGFHRLAVDIRRRQLGTVRLSGRLGRNDVRITLDRENTAVVRCLELDGFDLQKRVRGFHDLDVIAPSGPTSIISVTGSPV